MKEKELLGLQQYEYVAIEIQFKTMLNWVCFQLVRERYVETTFRIAAEAGGQRGLFCSSEFVHQGALYAFFIHENVRETRLGRSGHDY